MAIRPTGTYVSKNKGSKKAKSRAKENRFSKKQFFNLCTPAIFPVTTHGKTSHPKTKAKQDLSAFLVGRTFNVNQGDLNGNNTETHRNFNFKVARVRGSDCVGEFNGMYLARDKITNMIKKWHTLIDAHLDLTTADGSSWRFFVMGITKRLPNETKKNSYCQTVSAKKIRKIMFEVLKEEVEGCEVDKVINKLSSESIGKEIEARCSKIYPINAVITKVKALKNMKMYAPVKTDLSSLTELNNEFVFVDETN